MTIDRRSAPMMILSLARSKSSISTKRLLPRAADRVDLVDEDDARRVLLRLLEHVAHARRADADEHLDEVGARDGKERNLRLTRDRAGEERLAGARVADHQHAARDTAAELLE